MLKELNEKCKVFEERLKTSDEELLGEKEELLKYKKEADELAKRLEKLEKARAAAEEDYLMKEQFYKEYIQRVDEAEQAALQPQTDETGSPSPSVSPSAADIRLEFARKELELSVSILTRENAQLKAQLKEQLPGEAKDCSSPRVTELQEQVSKLVEELEQMEEHVLAQQQLRKEAQGELHKAVSEGKAERAALEKVHSDQQQQMEQKLKEANARERGLQAELAIAQRRGIAAQRQLDELRSVGDAGSETDASLGEGSSFSLQLASLQATLQKVEAENLSLTKRTHGLTTELTEARKYEVDASRNAVLLEEAESRAKAAEKSLSELQAQYDVLIVQHANAKSLLDQKVVEASSLRLEASQHHNTVLQCEELQKELNTVKIQACTAAAELSKLKSAGSGTESVIKSLKAEVKGLEDKLKQEYEAAVSTTTQLDLNRQGKAKVEAELVSVKTERDELKDAVKTERGKREAAETAAEASTQEISDLTHRLRTVQQEGEKDSEWLQTEVARARTRLEKTEKRLKEAEVKATSAEEEAWRMAEENKRLYKELRGESTVGTVTLPLPDHTKLPVPQVVDLVRGGMDSWNQILLSLENASAASSKTQDECAFLATLSQRMRAMLWHIESSSSYPNLSGTYQALTIKTDRIFEKLGYRS